MSRKLENRPMSESFSISVSSDFAGLWRYNIVIECECLDADGGSIEVCSECRHIADVGANLAAAPAGYVAPDKVVLTTPLCDNIKCIIYLIPHTLPSERVVADVKPFELKINITKGKHSMLDSTHLINQWSGGSISLQA